MLLSISRRKIVSSALGLLVSAALAVVATRPGIPVREVELNDGGVWVTNENLHMVGHLNYPSQVLDGSISAASGSFDVDQNGNTVFVSDQAQDAYTQVDVANEIFLDSNTTAGASRMELGGDRIGVVDANSGGVWVMPASSFSSWDPHATEPIYTSKPDAVLAMGIDGTAFIASAKAGSVTTISAAGSQNDVNTMPLDGIGQDDVLQVSAVGDQAVVLDQTSATLFLPSGTQVSLSGKGLQLQDPGENATEVLVSNSAQLLHVSLAGKVTETDSAATAGTASRPVHFAGCAYAAWSGDGAFVRDCAGTDNDINISAPQLSDASKAVFRSNRDVIVLNDAQDGSIWLPDEQMVEIDNWDQINSTLENKQKTDDQTSETEDTLEQTQRDDKNTPPKAVDDTFGVRPGQSSVLPVIYNDIDPDGDVLVATPDNNPSFGTVGQVEDGAALQVETDADASGTSSFTYTLDDGTATDQATVTLNVHPFSVNAGPDQLRKSTLTLAAGASGSVNVAGDWLDPDGDAIYLKSVSFPANLDVAYEANGTIKVKDLTGKTGTVDLTVTYSDGQADTDGVLQVTIKGDQNIAPIANGDHAVTAVGQTVQVSPLTNDFDANGDTLRLVSIGDAPAGVVATYDSDLGVVSLTPSEAGTTYITYTVSDGPTTSTGVIRLDAISADTQKLPVAMDDVATLPASGQALVAVLDNDTDPMGGVLTVQSVHTDPDSSLVVALLEHHLLRITAPSGLDQATTVTYTVANAAGTAEGHVRVIPVAAASTDDPPQLNDDSLVVRVGDVGSVDVLDNDSSPSGLKLSVDSKLQVVSGQDLGEFFVSDNVVRLRAGQTAGNGKVVYTVTDSAGNIASASVNVTVKAMDRDHDTAPHPQSVTAWAVSGQSTTIDIPLNGIDTEGDSVSLVGLGSSPSLGTVQVGTNSIVYTAGTNTSGTDVFTYTVKDRLGMTATAQIRVGIAPASGSNQRPVAVADQVTVRPGVKVSIPVLDNDVDPDGDQLSLVSKDVSTDDSALVLSTRGSHVVAKAPQKTGVYTFIYGVTDGKSEPVTGLVTVIVSPDAALRAPIARDDEVTTAQASASATVQVNVLDNDDDPDGDIYSDKLTSSDAGVKVNQDGSLSITIEENQRFVLYTVTDNDGLSASAVVDVPGKKITTPELNTAKLPLQVRAGQSITIPINDYVRTRSGHSAQITDRSKVHASVGWDGSNLVANSSTLTFGADIDYAGSSSVTFEVTDGANADDPDGEIATLTLPITVLPASNTAPSIVPTELSVAAGGNATTVDVSQWVTDPDGDDPASMKYAISNVPASINAAIQGSKLTVSAPAGTAAGAIGSLTLTVTDKNGNTSKAGVPVTVVDSTQELIQLSAISLTTSAGKAVSVDISNYATNPYPGTSLHIVGQPKASDGSTISTAGTVITITPPAGSSGTSTVTYVVGDKTNDAARQVQGSIQMTISDRPDAPTTVKATVVNANTVQISWSPGNSNGSAITGYTVYDLTQGDSKDCVAVTSCTMSGRTSGVTHTFNVVAHNANGDSDASVSASVNMDLVPATVAQPAATAGNGTVTVNWSAPSSSGSAISSYTVVLNPGGITQTVAGTSATFSGLSNGTSYTAVVKARNAAGESESWSAASAAVTPYGKPSSVGFVTAESSGSSGSLSVKVSWGPVRSTNGRAVEYYTVTSSTGDKQVVYGADNRSTTFTGLTPTGAQVTYSVTATNNKAAPSTNTSDAMSASTWLVATPVAPSVTKLAIVPGSLAITLSATANSGNGWSASELSLQWSTDGKTWQSTSDLSGNGLSYGKSSQIQVRACGSKNGEQKCSAATTAGSVLPKQPPNTPTVLASVLSTKVVLSWDATNSGTSGQSIDYVNLETTDRNFRSNDISGSVTQGDGYGVTKKIRAQACYSDGTCSAWSSWTGATTASPSPSWDTFAEGTCKPADIAWLGPNCSFIGVHVYGFAANKYVTCTFTDSSGGWHSTGKFKTDSSGNATGHFGNVTVTDQAAKTATTPELGFKCVQN